MTQQFLPFPQDSLSIYPRFTTLRLSPIDCSTDLNVPLQYKSCRTEPQIWDFCVQQMSTQHFSHGAKSSPGDLNSPTQLESSGPHVRGMLWNTRSVCCIHHSQTQLKRGGAELFAIQLTQGYRHLQPVHVLILVEIPPPPPIPI